MNEVSRWGTALEMSNRDWSQWKIEDLRSNVLFMVPGTHVLYKKGSNYDTECSATLLLPKPTRTTVHRLPVGTLVKAAGPGTIRRYEAEYGLEKEEA